MKKLKKGVTIDAIVTKVTRSVIEMDYQGMRLIMLAVDSSCSNPDELQHRYSIGDIVAVTVMREIDSIKGFRVCALL